MGGKVFASTRTANGPPLATPRMTPATYTRVRDHLATAVLPTFYTTVAWAREAPGKASYGDVDMLVSGRRGRGLEPTFSISSLAQAMGAVRWTRLGNSATVSFAVPADDHQHEDEEIAYHQVDVHECATSGDLRWLQFTHADGDLWSMWGPALRAFGFSIDERAFGVRIAAIEGAAKRYAWIALTSDPHATLAFLGLDPARYEAGFRSEAELFAFAAEMRFVGRRRGDDSRGDRHKLWTRPTFRRWMEEYLPARFGPGQEQARDAWDQGETRADALEEALDRFGQRAAYDARLAEWRAACAVESVWLRAQQLIPLHGPAAGLALRGLKKRIPLRAGQEPDVVDLVDLPDFRPCGGGDGGGIDEEAVLAWIGGNWKDVWCREKERIRLEQIERGGGGEKGLVGGREGEEQRGGNG
ncbi:MAG: hypothetical protein M1826_000886 [Phylliscum demangeonii]|nr:MAG: hypothetical protein M1826_000886 [Phylliscum demangeonii]